MNRRKFILSLVGSAAVGATVWKVRETHRAAAAGVDGGVGRKALAGGLSRITRGSQALGAQVTLTVYHDDIRAAEDALSAAFTGLDQVEQVMSLYRADSQICRLNRDGVLGNAHPWLLEVLAQAEQLSRASDGAFDITVQPLWELYSERAAAGSLPTDAELTAALGRVGWQRVEVAGGTVRLKGEGTRITLNGIAQGFAADVVGRMLAARGIRHAVIDTGEIGTLGAHPQKAAWQIGITHPRRPGELLEVADLNGRCMATSGDYETRFGEGFANHHLLDPRSGRSPAELASVSVVAPTATAADGLSTAVFMLGLREGRRLVESTDGADALFVMKDGRTERTSGFPVVNS